MAGDTRDLKVRWLGDARSLETSAKKAAGAVGGAGKQITGAGSKIGSVFASLGSKLGAFNLPFSKAASGVSSEMGKLEAAGVSMGEGIGGAATAGLSIAGAAAVEFGRESIEAAENFNKAHERLAVVVENVGEDMKAEQSAISSTDHNLEALGFTSTETESALAKLVPVTHDVGKATTLLNLATDIARARNMSLDDATSLLVQVEGGRMRGLQKLGIATKDATGKTITASQAVVALNNAFGGAASQYAQSYAGKLAIIKAQTNDLKIAFGNTLLPILGNFAEGVSVALDGIDVAAQHLHVNVSRVVSDVLSLGLNEIAHKAYDEMHKGANAAADAVNNLKKAQRDYANDLAQGNTTTEKAQHDREALNEAQKKADEINQGLAAAAKTSTQAQQDQNAATEKAKKDSEEHAKVLQTERAAILGVRDANIALDNAQLGVADSLDTYNQKALIAQAAGGKNAAANRDWERASNDVKSAIDNVAASAAQAADQQDDLRGATHSAAHESHAQREALEKLRDTIKPGSPFRSYLDALIRQLDEAAKPRTETFHVIAPGIVYNPRTGVVSGHGVRMFDEGGVVPGPIGTPVPAIVHGGERVLTPQQQSSGGGVSNTYSITVNVAPGGDPAATGKAVVDAIRAYERRNGRSWRGAA